MAFKKFAEFLSEQKGTKMPGATEQPLGKKGKLPTQYHAKGAKEDRGLVTADDNRGTPLGDKGMPNMSPKTPCQWVKNLLAHQRASKAAKAKCLST